jgi:aromatic ring-opening dioxygenase catalytic subunit (LigB family)
MPEHLGVKPKAILMISAHWEENDFAIMSHANPPMLYDYGGFPDHTYHIKYPAPGDPGLAKEVNTLLKNAGLPSHLDGERGFDHGSFAPMFAIYPKADVPVVQLSIQSGYEPNIHIDVGRALAPLRDQGVLIIGSGLSYHNLREIFNPARAKIPSIQFDDWLQTTLLNSNSEERLKRLKNWSEAPSARKAHPREDHLIPLMVAVGAAELEPAEMVYHEIFRDSFAASSFRFG